VDISFFAAISDNSLRFLLIAVDPIGRSPYVHGGDCVPGAVIVTILAASAHSSVFVFGSQTMPYLFHLRYSLVIVWQVICG